MKIATNNEGHLVELWQVTVDVQKHFNDLEMKSRNFGITILSAAYAGAGIAFFNLYSFGVGLLGGVPVHSLIIGIATIVWLLIWVMDRHWYHRLLVGAVKAGMDLEAKLQSSGLPLAKMTHEISKASQFRFLGRKILARSRIDVFYWTIVVLNVGLIVLPCSKWSAFFAVCLGELAMLVVVYLMCDKVET